VETIKAYGHPNIKALHKTTLEVTKEKELTPRGDCIVGVRADKAVLDLDQRFKETIRNDQAIIVVILEVDDLRDIILAHGHHSLQLSDPMRIIIRKSAYIEPATLAIKANKSARDVDRRLIDKLRRKDTLLTIKLYALTIDVFQKIERMTALH